MSTRTTIPAALTLAALSALVPLAGCGGGGEQAVARESPASAALAPQPVTVAEVARRDFTPVLEATGTLVPRRQAELRALVDGQLDALPVDIGTRVGAGQLLFRIREADFRLAVQQAEASVQRAGVLLADREREAARMEGLFREGSATEQMKDQSATALQEARAALAEARARRDLAQQSLADAVQAAPYAGVVTARHRQRGEFVNRGDPVVELMDLSVLDAEMEVPERHAGEVAPGLAVEIRAGASGQPVPGKVVAVNPKIDVAQRTFTVKVEVDNRDGRLQAGLFVRGRFDLPPARGQLAVPGTAVVRDQGRTAVWVADGGRAVRREVRAGSSAGDWVQILDGVSEGERVIVEGWNGLVDGSAIEVREAG